MREREKERIFQADSPLSSDLDDPWDHELSQTKRQTLNQLSLPGTPSLLVFVALYLTNLLLADFEIVFSFSLLRMCNLCFSG